MVWKRKESWRTCWKESIMKIQAMNTHGDVPMGIPGLMAMENAPCYRSRGIQVVPTMRTRDTDILENERSLHTMQMQTNCVCTGICRWLYIYIYTHILFYLLIYLFTYLFAYSFMYVDMQTYRYDYIYRYRFIYIIACTCKRSCMLLVYGFDGQTFQFTYIMFWLSI